MPNKWWKIDTLTQTAAATAERMESQPVAISQHELGNTSGKMKNTTGSKKVNCGSERIVINRKTKPNQSVQGVDEINRAFEKHACKRVTDFHAL